jgi:hypothetical protein
MTPALSHFPIVLRTLRVRYHSVANPSAQYLPKRLVWYRVIEPSVRVFADVHVDTVSAVYVHAFFPYPVKTLASRFAWPKPMREVIELLLVYRLQRQLCRPLEYFVFIRRYAYGPPFNPQLVVST